MTKEASLRLLFQFLRKGCESMRKVLIVDDTKNIRVLLTKCLEMEGYEVKIANDGQKAVEMFLAESFDLAFLDIKMPHYSGTEGLKQIREKGITTPVIIITAYATVKNAVECTQMGAVAYLQKPFTAEKVRSKLNEIALEGENCIEERVYKLIDTKNTLVNLVLLLNTYKII